MPCISESCIEMKIKLNFYFHTSLRCLKRFYEGFKVLHKTFRGNSAIWKSISNVINTIREESLKKFANSTLWNGSRSHKWKQTTALHKFYWCQCLFPGGLPWVEGETYFSLRFLRFSWVSVVCGPNFVKILELKSNFRTSLVTMVFSSGYIYLKH